MIAVDTNVLVHAHRGESRHYRAAYSCLANLCENTEAWAIPWPCIHEFLSIATNTWAFARASSPAEALRQVDVWLESPGLVLLEETVRHWSILLNLVRSSRATGGRIHDARIAAICLEHGVRELWTADRDFARFPELATFNPLTDDQVHETPAGYAAVLRARTAGRRRALTGISAR
ncbi:MAG TPA: TA system VapC family ribonuclease toxin [Candidatus Limnocylindrales bacterium]|nr:TA system VapC family ribonuclease toxin [Candidatus Limnocylindrales bacterium]